METKDIIISTQFTPLKALYIAPVIKIIEVRVEQGFFASLNNNPNDGDDEATY